MFANYSIGSYLVHIQSLAIYPRRVWNWESGIAFAKNGICIAIDEISNRSITNSCSFLHVTSPCSPSVDAHTFDLNRLGVFPNKQNFSERYSGKGLRTINPYQRVICVNFILSSEISRRTMSSCCGSFDTYYVFRKTLQFEQLGTKPELKRKQKSLEQKLIMSKSERLFVKLSKKLFTVQKQNQTRLILVLLRVNH